MDYRLSHQLDREGILHIKSNGSPSWESSYNLLFESRSLEAIRAKKELIVDDKRKFFQRKYLSVNCVDLHLGNFQELKKKFKKMTASFLKFRKYELQLNKSVGISDSKRITTEKGEIITVEESVKSYTKIIDLGINNLNSNTLVIEKQYGKYSNTNILFMQFIKNLKNIDTIEITLNPCKGNISVLNIINRTLLLFKRISSFSFNAFDPKHVYSYAEILTFSKVLSKLTNLQSLIIHNSLAMNVTLYKILQSIQQLSLLEHLSLCFTFLLEQDFLYGLITILQKLKNLKSLSMKIKYYGLLYKNDSSVWSALFQNLEKSCVIKLILDFVDVIINQQTWSCISNLLSNLTKLRHLELYIIYKHEIASQFCKAINMLPNLEYLSTNICLYNTCHVFDDIKNPHRNIKHIISRDMNSKALSPPHESDNNVLKKKHYIWTSLNLKWISQVELIKCLKLIDLFYWSNSINTTSNDDNTITPALNSTNTTIDITDTTESSNRILTNDFYNDDYLHCINSSVYLRTSLKSLRIYILVIQPDYFMFLTRLENLIELELKLFIQDFFDIDTFDFVLSTLNHLKNLALHIGFYLNEENYTKINTNSNNDKLLKGKLDQFLKWTLEKNVLEKLALNLPYTLFGNIKFIANLFLMVSKSLNIDQFFLMVPIQENELRTQSKLYGIKLMNDNDNMCILYFQGNKKQILEQLKDLDIRTKDTESIIKEIKKL